ncbi:MAG: nucleotidyltransferase family protein, partial [Prevotella sp.]|nr:nucleotidyltransferase family protein [Prevotella sp.]
MNDTKGTLIRLMRMAVGCEPYEPMTLSEREWKAVYIQVCQQTLTGVIYCVVNRMSRDVGIPKPLLMEWTLKAEAIRGFNAKMNAEAARLTRWFGERGRKTAILKGQANARLYPHPDERQPGDIDIWVEGGRDSVVKLLGDEGVLDTKDTVSYHHAHLKKNANGISVEVHFRPSSGNYNPITNRRLQRFLE